MNLSKSFALRVYVEIPLILHSVVKKIFSAICYKGKDISFVWLIIYEQFTTGVN